jgi:hypothetical protein
LCVFLGEESERDWGSGGWWKKAGGPGGGSGGFGGGGGGGGGGRIMTTTNERKVIELEQGWAFMQKGITKLKNLLEGVPEQQFNSEEYIMLYTYFFPLLYVPLPPCLSPLAFVCNKLNGVFLSSLRPDGYIF